MEDELYRLLLKTTDTGFVVVDQAGRVLAANEIYVRLAGRENFSEIVGRSVIEWTAEYEKERNVKAVEKCVAEGQMRNLEIDYIDPRGKITPVELNATVHRSNGSLRILTVCRDISARRRVQAEILAAKEAAETAVSIRSQFLNMAAHELKTPVTAFLLMLEVAQAEVKRGRPFELSLLDRIHGQAKRLSRLVVDLLDVSRLERGSLVLERVPTDMVALASACVEDFRIQAPHSHIVFIKPEKAIVIEVDPVGIAQVLSNLLDNAVKYTSAGGQIEVTVEPSPDRVRVSVIDHGKGIPKEQQPDLFKPFTRGNTDLETQISGLGLGLYVCQARVDLHGGKIGVVSEMGVGSSFYFELPRGAAQIPV